MMAYSQQRNTVTTWHSNMASSRLLSRPAGTPSMTGPASLKAGISATHMTVVLMPSRTLLTLSNSFTRYTNRKFSIRHIDSPYMNKFRKKNATIGLQSVCIKPASCGATAPACPFAPCTPESFTGRSFLGEGMKQMTMAMFNP